MQIQNWEPHRHYNPGDVVYFEGRVYRNLQPHRSQIDWSPGATPALWCLQPGGPPNFPSPNYGNRPPTNSLSRPPPPIPPVARRPSPQPPAADFVGGLAFPRAPPFPGGPSFPESPSFPEAVGLPPTYPQRDYQSDSQRGFQQDPPASFGPPDFPPPQIHDRGIRRSPGPQAPIVPPRQPAQGGRYRSSSDWIEDAKRRTAEFHAQGPKGPTTWLLVEYGQIPQYAIQAGQHSNGQPLYVARNFHEGGLHIGWASSNGATLSWGGAEVPLATYEVLIGESSKVRWQKASGGEHAQPIEGGYEADGTPLWIVQTLFGGGIVPGKASGWNTGAHIAYGGGEQIVGEYNVLVSA